MNQTEMIEIAQWETSTKFNVGLHGIVHRFWQQYFEEIAPGLLLIAADSQVQRMSIVERIALMDVAARHVEKITGFEYNVDAWRDVVEDAGIEIATGFQWENLVVVQRLVNTPVLFAFELKNEGVDVV